jgi:20S proteasome alpha/beta subunit
MTTVIGCTNGKNVLMIGDKSASDGNTTVISITPKVFNVGGGVLVGFSGDWRGGQLGIQALIDLDTEDPDCGIERMVAAIAQTFSEADYKNEETLFLIGYGGQLFEVQPNLGYIAIYGEYHAIGEGSQFALGALWEMCKEAGELSVSHLTEALRAAAKWTGSSTLFDWVETND